MSTFARCGWAQGVGLEQGWGRNAVLCHEPSEARRWDVAASCL